MGTGFPQKMRRNKENVVNETRARCFSRIDPRLGAHGVLHRAWHPANFGADDFGGSAAVLLSNEQKRFYLDNGYLVVKRGVPKGAYREAQDAALRVVEKCANGSYPHCRADKRLSDRFIEKIDHVFHPDLFEPAIFRAVVESKILDYAKEAIGYSDVFCSFYRMHPTIGYSTWSSWHRDDDPDGRDWTIKATLPLFPECGFAVVPGSHVAGDKCLNNWRPIAGPASAVDTTFKGRIPTKSMFRSRPEIFFCSTPRLLTGVPVPVDQRINVRKSTSGSQRRNTPRRHRGCARTGRSRDRKCWHSPTSPGKMCSPNRLIRRNSIRRPSAANRRPVWANLRQLGARAFYYGSALLPSSHTWVTDPPKGYLPYVRVAPGASVAV